MKEIETFSTMKLVSKDSPEPYLNKGSLLLVTDKIERNKQAMNQFKDEVKKQIEVQKLDVKTGVTNSRPLEDILDPGEEEITIVNDGYPKDEKVGYEDPSEDPDDDKIHYWGESGSFSRMTLINK